MVALVTTAGCGSLNFFHRSPDSVINVQGAVFGPARDAVCELKVLSTNGRTVETLQIAPVFDRSVVVAPARAKRVFEVSCAGQPGAFRSRVYKANGWTQVDLGTIALTSPGVAVNFQRR